MACLRSVNHGAAVISRTAARQRKADRWPCRRLEALRTTVLLDDDFASGRHARIYHRDNAWFVEDLGSTNGTFLGSERLTTPVRVETGTTLRIGKTVIELRR